MALMNTTKIRWDTLRHFSGVLDKHVPLCMEVLRAKGFHSSEKVRLHCTMHYLPKYDFATPINLPA